MRCADDRELATLWSAAFVLTLGIFVLWPQLDIMVSRVFWTPRAGFWLGRVTELQALRTVVWNASIAMFLASIGFFLAALVRKPVFGIGARVWGYIALLYLLGPILLVNGLLKSFWGRARPADVVEFGGSQQFTPPYMPSDQCAANCSFVSGEGSAATALAVALLVLAPHVRRALPSWAFRVYVALSVAVPAIGLGMRLATGRHFLSDTLFAVLFVLGIAIALRRILRPEASPHGA